MTPTAIARLAAHLADRYRIDDELGSGGMAVVHRALDLRHGRTVAIKVLRPELAAALGPERFLREIRVAARLQHPNIVPLLDSGELPGDSGAAPVLWYAMPLIEGESLRARLVREGAQTLDDALRWTRELADALAHAHQHGVVHRDIKPENILLTGAVERHALLADFGVARALESSVDERLTESGISLGTPAYMSPEQSVGDSTIDGRSDLYSLGCVLYEMLTGEPAFSARTSQALIAKRLSDAVPSVRSLRETVPPWVDGLVRRLMAKTPADRFAGAADLVTALASPHADTQTTVEVAAHPRDRRDPSRGVLVGLVLAAILVAGVLLGINHLRASGQTSLDPVAVAVLPFRITAPDRSLDYLAEGIVDLLAVKFGGPVGPRAVPPRQLLSLLRYKPGMQVTAEQGEDAARRAGAGLLLDGNVVESGASLELSGDLRPTDKRGRTVHATVSGAADSLPSLVDRFAAQLLAGQGERTTSLGELSTSKAISEYLQGVAAHRRGQYTVATAHFAAALREDSTFALAALDMIASLRGDDVDAIARAGRLAWANRAKLSQRGLTLLRARVGPKYPAPSSMIVLLAAWQDAAAAAPDLPDVWFELGDRQLHFGVLNDVPRAVELAERSFSRALELDSSFAWPLEHLLMSKFWLEDTTRLRIIAKQWSAQDTSSGDRADYFRWRVALALGDSAEVGRERARLDRWHEESVIWLAGAAQSEAVGLGDVQLAIKELERRAVTGARLANTRQRWRDWLLNAGRPSEALALTDSLASEEPYPGWARLTRIEDALFWNGDTVAAAAEVRALAKGANATSPGDSIATSVRARGYCRLGLWALAHGDRAGVRLWLGKLRGRRLTAIGVFNEDDRTVCADLLDAWSVLPDRPAKALALLQRTDSIYLDSDILDDYAVTNLVTARLREAAGDLAGARRTIERVPVELPVSPQYEGTYFREQARLELEAGDTVTAMRALRRYVALSSDAEPSVRAEVNTARAQLSALVGR